ncbi:MAG TPA: ribose-phosphate pyrophosphokinase, partial [Kofleriaceae bacterium]|nr:ribose-phosphate pyrophosphokinase [Kofleriaceae bacterium]
TGGSLLGAAAAYRAAGATSVAAVTTHGAFVDGAIDRMQSSGLLTAVVATNSHPRALTGRPPFVRLESVAPLLADRLRGGA